MSNGVFTLAGAEALGLGYLLGSIPFGLIFTWLSGAGDVRKVGSGNIGATNVLRTGKRWAAAATLVSDAGKGVAAVLIARRIWGDDAATIAALGAILGHLFPLWLGFKGGKGVATTLGVLLALFWPVGLITAALWLLAALIWRISSLSALIAVALSPLVMLAFGLASYAILSAIVAALVLVMHRDNIGRLMRGEEPRIGAKSSS
jgi:glycerol-3-phosphate acyltransferase PlsY